MFLFFLSNKKERKTLAFTVFDFVKNTYKKNKKEIKTIETPEIQSEKTNIVKRTNHTNLIRRDFLGT